MNYVLMKMRLLGVRPPFLVLLWLSTYVIVAVPVVSYPRPPVRPPPPPPRHLQVRCRNIAFPACFNIWLRCPFGCPTRCLMDCASCRPVCSCNIPGAVCEDPRFVGGDGITFYFHGRKDQNFCLVSDSNLHINAHFIGKRNPNLKRDFTWVQSIGIMFHSHKLLVATKQTALWDDSVDRLAISFDDTPLSLPTNEGSVWHSQTAPIATISRTSDTNGIMVEVDNSFRINAVVVPITAQESRVHGYNITDENCFAHLEIGFKFYNLTGMVDGVLGQTYRSDYMSKMKVNVSMPVMGGLRKFSSSGIFATDCAVAQFGRNAIPRERGIQYSSMKCSSGINGTGVVCKR